MKQNLALVRSPEGVVSVKPTVKRYRAKRRQRLGCAVNGRAHHWRAVDTVNGWTEFECVRSGEHPGCGLRKRERAS